MKFVEMVEFESWIEKKVNLKVSNVYTPKICDAMSFNGSCVDVERSEQNAQKEKECEEEESEIESRRRKLCAR